MKKFVLPVFAVLAFGFVATFADAGPFGIFRGRFLGRQSQSCANGQCAPQESGMQACPDGVCQVPSSTPKQIAKAPEEEVPLLASRKLDARSFAGNLQKHVEGKTAKERQILNIINGPDSPRRTSQLARMERHVRAELDLPFNAAVDWSAIDWPTLLPKILQLLMKLLPLLLAL